jgi:hypothetical protein
MSAIKLPQWVFEVNPKRANSGDTSEKENMTNPSSLWNYLGLRGTGTVSPGSAIKEREFNAIPILGYYDIFKNYYANKQEDNFYLMDYYNRLTTVVGMSTRTPGTGTTVWTERNPNMFNNARVLLETESINLTLAGGNSMDQNEFEALTTVTVRVDQSTPGYTSEKTIETPLTQFFEFISYTPATLTYNYAIKVGTELARITILSITTKKGKLQAQALSDIDEIRELILGTQGNTPFRISANNTTVKFNC